MELRRSGRKVSVQEKPVQLLAILLQRPGQLFSRAELRQRLWPADTFVDFEHSLNTAVRKLREALGDHAAQPEFIETVSHHGYRLIAPVSGLRSQGKRPRLVVLPVESLGQADDCISKALREALITQLGMKCTILDVIAPPAFLHPHNTSESWKELSPDYLLSTSLMRPKDQARITVRLVGSDDLSCLWCDSYTRMHPEDLLVQDEVAAGIAQSVFEFFSPSEFKRQAG